VQQSLSSWTPPLPAAAPLAGERVVVQVALFCEGGDYAVDDLGVVTWSQAAPYFGLAAPPITKEAESGAPSGQIVGVPL